MRAKFFLAALSWAIGMLIVMCTNDAKAFLYEQKLNYELNVNPDFFDFFGYSDINLTDAFYLLQKTGHMFSFGFLYLLVFYWLQNHRRSFWVCAVFAFFSEIIQLFFHRNGRLFDVGVDVLGIFLVSLILKYVSAKKVNTN